MFTEQVFCTFLKEFPRFIPQPTASEGVFSRRNYKIISHFCHMSITHGLKTDGLVTTQ